MSDVPKQTDSPVYEAVSKTVMTLTMIHPATLDPNKMSNLSVAHHLDQGEFRGVRTSVETTSVADADVPAELAKMGDDGSMFLAPQPLVPINTTIAK